MNIGSSLDDLPVEKHYVCGGDCGAVSKKPRVCNSLGCTKEGDAMVECACADGRHDSVKGEGSHPQEIEI